MSASTASLRPIVLALVPPAPGRCSDEIPAATELGGTCLVHRLLNTLAQVGLPSPLVLTTAPAVPRLRELLGPQVEVRGAPADRTRAISSVMAEVTEPWVMILDAERALTPASVVTEVIAAVSDDVDAVVPVTPMTDSVKLTSGRGLHNVDRATLGNLQSPRLLRRSVLEQALRVSGDDHSDEVLAALACDARVRTVHGSHAGFAVVDRLSLWQAQISLGLARDTSHRHGLPRRS